MPSYILTLKERKTWSELLSKLPLDQQDLYYTPEYYELYENNGFGKAICFVFKIGKEIALYPFLMNSVNRLGFKLENDYFDIQGAYGYNGVISSSYSTAFRMGFFNELKKYCVNNNIIAEFTRFNPLLYNHEFSNYLEVVNINKDILLSLNNSEKDTWDNFYDRSVRKNVNKAIRNGLTVKQFNGDEISDVWLSKFKEIYFSTLNRRKADTYYYFSNEYFSQWVQNMGKNSLFFFTIKSEKPISCELITYKNYHAYSFLGGTLSEYFNLRPNDLLKHCIFNHLRKIGVKNICLGGGVKEGDGIYKYKKSFSKNGSQKFYIGKHIYINEVYEDVCMQWENKYPQKRDYYSNFLLRYHH